MNSNKDSELKKSTILRGRSRGRGRDRGRGRGRSRGRGGGRAGKGRGRGSISRAVEENIGDTARTPSPARADSSIVSSKETKEGQASPTKKRKFDIHPKDDLSNVPLKSDDVELVELSQEPGQNEVFLEENDKLIRFKRSEFVLPNTGKRDNNLQEEPNQVAMSLNLNDMGDVTEDNFISERSQDIVFSVLSLLPYFNELKKFATKLFHFHNDKVTNWKITDEHENKLLDFIAKKLLSKDFSKISENEEGTKVLQLPKDRYFTMQSLLRLHGTKNNGWIGDEIIDFVSDVINLCTGAHHYAQTHPLPKFIVADQASFQLCMCLGDFDDLRPTIQFDDLSFETKLRAYCTRGHGINAITNIINVFNNREDSNVNHEDEDLEQIFGIININKSHFVHVTIDLENEMIVTRDPFQSGDSACKYRKWIAKMAGIAKHYLMSSNIVKAMYFGNDDIKSGDSFTEKMKEQMQSSNEYDFMFFHEERKETKFPKQKDLINCGLYSIWYNALSIFENEGMNKFDPLQLRRKIILCVIVLYLLEEAKVENNEMNKGIEKWLCSAGVDDSLSSVFQEIFVNSGKTENDDDGHTTNNSEGDLTDQLKFMHCSGVVKYMKKFRSLMQKKTTHYFCKEELKTIIGEDENFPDTLIDLSQSESSTISVILHWKYNKMTRLVKKFYDVVSEVFLDNAEAEAKLIKKVIEKSSTMFVSLQSQPKAAGEQRNITFIAFACVTPIFENKELICMIVDYIGVTTKSPNDVLSDFNHTFFTGKGIGKFMLNVVQGIGWALSTKNKEFCTKLLLKADEEKAGFYKAVGFRKVTTKDVPFLNTSGIKQHFQSLKIHTSLVPFILDNASVINLKKSLFINHLEKKLDSITFDQEFDTSIDDRVHPILELDHIVDQTFVITSEDIDKKHGGFSLPIGEIVLELYKDFCPFEYIICNSLYQLLVQNISWQVTVEIKQKVFASKRKPIDDMTNPTACVELFCNLCGKSYDHKFDLKQSKKEDTSVETRRAVKKALKWFFDEHFMAGNIGSESTVVCQEIDFEDMKMARDKEMLMVGYNPHLVKMNQKLFEKLIHYILQLHIERHKILRYFEWTQLRPTKFGRNSKLFTAIKSKKETVDAVLGKHESAKRKEQVKKVEDTFNSNRMRANMKEWEDLWDDLIFLNRLVSLSYVNFRAKDYPEKERFMETVSNPGAINIFKDKYLWIGYSDTSKKSSNKEWYSHFMKEDFGKGSARVLRNQWIVDNVEESFISNLKQERNWDRSFTISKKTRKKIGNNMASLRAKNVTRIYKYTCETTYQMKFCNAVAVRQQKSNKSKMKFEAIKTDEITKEWLYVTAVKMNNCLNWFNKVMDPAVTDKFFELPTAAVLKKTLTIPSKVANAPILQYPQQMEGICGISAFSSCFYYRFDRHLGFMIYRHKQKYKEALGEALVNKRSPAMKCLNSLIQENQKVFGDYTVVRVKRMLSWKQLLQSEYYNNIILCIPKSTELSKDHIIGVTQGWIFDGNLEYAVPLTEENITWTASHGKDGIVFSGFWEQVIVKKKENL